MKRRRVILTLLVCGLVLGLGGALFSAITAHDKASLQTPNGKLETQHVEGQVIVKFQPKVRFSTVKNLAESLSYVVEKRFENLSRMKQCEYALLSSNTKSTKQMIKDLSGLPEIKSVSLNYVFHTCAVPKDPMAREQWALRNKGQSGGTEDADIDAYEAWDITTGSGTIILANIDSGVDYGHPDLIANLWVNPNEIADDGIDNDNNGYVDDIYGINSIDGSGDPMDDNGHGTHTFSIMAAATNNDLGMAGVCWNAKVMSLKFLSADGSGSTDNAISCLEYLIDQKVNKGQNIVAVNNSWGGGGYSEPLKDAIDAAGDANIIFCAASGNGGYDNDIWPHYPSSYDSLNIIAVTATDHNDGQTYNYGAETVDIGAPGVEIIGAVPGTYVPQDGDIFFDDMESGDDNWETGGTNNTWAVTEDQGSLANPNFPVPSPTHFLSMSPGTAYAPDTDSWIALKNDLDLSDYQGQTVYLGFGCAVALWVDDHGYVELSGDGGATWTSIMDFTNQGYYWYNGYQWEIPEEFKTANFRLRFHTVTDSSIEWFGWLIDNVGIGTQLTYSYQAWSGTSMACPMVTGVVGLLATQYPAEPYLDTVLRVMASGDPIPSLAGITLTGKRLNALNALELAAIPPYIHEVSPNTELTPTIPFVITGVHFGTDPGEVIWETKTRKNHTCTITSWSDTEIHAKAPRASFGDYTLKVRDAAGTLSFNGIPVRSYPLPSKSLLIEDFEGTFPPAGWEVKDNIETGLVWERNDTLGLTNLSGGSGTSAVASSDVLDNQMVGMDTELISPLVNLHGNYERIVLTYNSYYVPWMNSTAYVDISLDKGRSWTNLVTLTNLPHGPQKDEINLSAYVGNTIMLRWVYKDNYSWEWFWDVDNVEILVWGKSDDLLGIWENAGVWCKNSDMLSWTLLEKKDAVQVATGDIDGDGSDDLVGWWDDPNGIWIRYTASGKWEKVLAVKNLLWITTADLNQDGQDDVLGSWNYFGICWRDSATGNWTQLREDPAERIAAGDMDGDGHDDLCIWYPADGLWILKSTNGGWINLFPPSGFMRNMDAPKGGYIWHTLGDVNNDGKADLILSWEYFGVWFRDTATGNWKQVHKQPARIIASGDINGDLMDDLLGVWETIPGVWIRYSETGTWEKLHEISPLWIAAGRMR